MTTDPTRSDAGPRRGPSPGPSPGAWDVPAHGAAAPKGRLARCLAAIWEDKAWWLVPMVLFVRVAWAVSRSSHLMGRFVRAAGWLILLQLAWGAGEGAGSLAGAGRSDTQWR